MSHPLLVSEHLATLHDAARRRAVEMRNEAMAEFGSRSLAALARAWGRLRGTPTKKGAPRRAPFAAECSSAT